MSTETTVTLKQIAAELAAAKDLSKKAAEEALSEAVHLVIGHLKSGSKVRLTGLGILQVKDKPARTGRNPSTGAAIEIAASKKVGFKVAKELKDAVA